MTDTTYAILLDSAGNISTDDEGFSRLLNSAKVRNAKATKEDQQLPDGGGLLLFVSSAGAKSWRYRFRLGGKGQTLTIGTYPEIGLADARQAHRAARALVAKGISPKAFADAEIQRREAERRAADVSTFRALWDDYNEATAPNLAKRTIYNRDSRMKNHILPIIGERQISQITRRELAELLTRIDRTHPPTAKHCRMLIKQIFDTAVDRDLIPGNPTPRLAVLVGQRGRKGTPHSALPVSLLGRFLVDLDGPNPRTDPLTKAALLLVLLTWTRSIEAVGAEWEEFDLDAGIWRIPAERMKGREPHTVYLSHQAVSLIREVALISHGRFLFPNVRRPGEAHMDRGSPRRLRDRMGYAGNDIHGFRSVGSTWANESGRYRPDVIEAALAHKETDRIRAAYNRAEFADELRILWQDWADFLDERKAVERGETVIKISERMAG